MNFLLANKAVEFYSPWDGRWHNGKIIGCDVINSTYHLFLQGGQIQRQVERKFLRNVGSHWNNWYDMLSVKTKVKCIESGQLGTIWHIDDNGHATIMFESGRTELKVKPHLYCIVNDETGEELSFLPNDEDDEDDITNVKAEPSCVPMVTDEDDDFCSDSLHSSSQSQPHSHSESLCLYSDSLLGEEEEYEMEVAMECESDSDSEVPEVPQPKPQLSQQPQLSRREVVDLSQSPELPDETGETPPATESHHCQAPATPVSPIESVARPFISSSDPLTSHHHPQQLFSTEEVAPTHRVTTYGVDPPPLVSPTEESFIAGNHQEEAEKAVATTQRDVPQFPVCVNQQQTSSINSSPVSLPLFGAKISPAGEASRSAAENVNSAGASVSFGEGGAGGAALHREETSESGRDPLLNNRSRCEEGTKQETSAVSCYDALPEYDRKYLNYLKNSIKGSTYSVYEINSVLHSLNTTQLLRLEVYTLRNLLYESEFKRRMRVNQLSLGLYNHMHHIVGVVTKTNHNQMARNCLVDLFLSLSPEEQQDLTSDKLLRMAKQWQATKHIILAYTAPPLEPRMITLSCPELDTTQTADLNELLKTTEPKYNRFKEFKARVLDLVGYTKTFRHEENLKNPASSYYINIKRADDYVDNVTVFRVRKGWSVEVGEDAEASACESVFFNNLQVGDHLEVRRFGVAFVGGKFRLSSIAAAERFNESLQTKVAQLSQQYVGFRKIRGDGNCYYRAIVFGLLEFVIVSGHRHILRQMYDCFCSVLYEEWTKEYQHHQKLLTHLQLAIEGQCWQTVAEFERDLLLSGSGLDQTIVRACKHVVANMLVARQLEVCNGMTVQDAVLLAYDDISSVEAFCEKYVLRMEVCAEGIHVNLGVLPSALGCHCTIVLLPRDRDSRIATIENKVVGEGEGEAAGSSLCMLHLLLRPGHYDLLYTATGPGIDVSDPDTVFVPPAPLPASAGSSTAASTPASGTSISASSYEESYPTLPAKTTRSGTSFSVFNPLSWLQVDNKKATGKRKGIEFESLYKSPQFHRDVQKIMELCGVTETEAEDLRRKYITVDFALEQYFSRSDISSSAVVAQDVLNEGNSSDVQNIVSEECAPDATCSSSNEMLGDSTSEHFQRYATHVPGDSSDSMLAPLPAPSSQQVQLTPVEQVTSVLLVPARTAEKLLAQHVTPERAVEVFLGLSDAQRESFEKEPPPVVQDMNAKVSSDNGKSSATEKKTSHVKVVTVADPEAANLKRIQSNMARFSEYRLQHKTRLSYPPRAELVLRLANDLQFKLDDVVHAVANMNFSNVYAYIRFKRCESIGKDSGLTETDIIGCTPDRDAQLVSLYVELIGRGFDRREVLDAIAFDRCTSVEDAEDVLTDAMKTRLEGPSASTPSLRNLSRVFNHFRSRDDSAPRITVTRRSELAFSYEFETKYQVPDPDSLHVLGRSAIMRALTTEPLNLKAGDVRTQSTRELRALLQAQLVANYEKVKPPSTVTLAMSAVKSWTDHLFHT